jgi:hypothetical protein
MNSARFWCEKCGKLCGVSYVEKGKNVCEKCTKYLMPAPTRK